MEVLSIKVDHVINESITAPELRVVTDDGQQLGIMNKNAALDAAVERDKDLVLIAPKAKPPVAKIMDYGKFKFETQKREKEAKKKQKVIEVKEVRLSPTIEEHDIMVRVKNAMKFLGQGNKLKVSIRFRGRQMAHTEVGYDVMKDFAKRLEEVAVVETRAKMEGRNMTMMMGPITKK
jgi:translation initiation factor IF-3